MNEIIKNRLYDDTFVNNWVKDFDACEAVRGAINTPEWAETETHVEKPRPIRKLAREIRRSQTQGDLPHRLVCCPLMRTNSTCGVHFCS